MIRSERIGFTFLAWAFLVLSIIALFYGWVFLFEGLILFSCGFFHLVRLP